MQLRGTRNNESLKRKEKKKKVGARIYGKKFTSLKGIYRRKYSPSTFLTSLSFPLRRAHAINLQPGMQYLFVGWETDKKKMAIFGSTRLFIESFFSLSCQALLELFSRERYKKRNDDRVTDPFYVTIILRKVFFVIPWCM